MRQNDASNEINIGVKQAFFIVKKGEVIISIV